MNRYCDKLRSKVVSVESQTIRLACLKNTGQAADIGNPITFNGYGRIHLFSEVPKPGWIGDPLPALPAAKALGCRVEDTRRTQVFQIAACNLRCWYCFVDDSSLSPDPAVSREFGIEHLVSQFYLMPERPMVIDLSGGNPGLAPEWILWTVRAIRDRGSDPSYVWADDNLTVDFYSKNLSARELDEIADFPWFGSVGCFKGFDPESFSFNTGGRPEEYFAQFEIFRSLLKLRWDLYGYVTFTSPDSNSISSRIVDFVDRLQSIDENLPLRTVPLEIRPYTPTRTRMREKHKLAISVQYQALECWMEQLDRRFSPKLREKKICDIPIASRSQ